MKPFGTLAPLLMAAAVILPVTSQAREYLGFGQEGDPGSLSFQNYAQFNHSSPSSNSIENFFELSYFTNTAFTGTTRDQLEFWVGFNGGYATTHGATGSSGFGISAPELGVEYYLDVIQPKVAVGKPGYLTFWTSPYGDVNFPNGNTQSSGFGAGADQFSFDVGVDNFIQIDNIAITVNPVTVHYAASNLNTVADATIPGATRKDRGGLSLTFADGGIGYQVTPNWLVGVMHQFNVNNISGSTFKSSREGFAGPAFTYAGFASRGLFISGTVETDYYNQGLTHQTYVAAWLSKEF
jgi:hypothetical protein